MKSPRRRAVATVAAAVATVTAVVAVVAVAAAAVVVIVEVVVVVLWLLRKVHRKLFLLGGGVKLNVNTSLFVFNFLA